MIILHIIFTLNVGGAETMLVDIVNEQCEENEVTLVVIDESYNRDLLDTISSNVKLVLLNRKPGSRSLIPFFRLNWLLLRRHADVVHIHNWNTPRILLPWIRPFFTVHGMGRPATYYHRLKGIIAISEAVKEDVKSAGDYPVTVIPNGIVADLIRKKEVLERKPFFKIVQVGRLEIELKGQDVLIDAIAKLRDEGIDNVDVDIIGDGNSKGILQAQIERLGLNGQVHLLGSMGRSQLYNSLCEYDFLCQPSRQEGFGLTVVEAMAARLPVLVADCGGPYEIIEKGRLGYCFKNNDPCDCAEAIKRIMEDYGNEQMCILINNAYSKALEEYSIRRTVHDYMRLYTSSR